MIPFGRNPRALALHLSQCLKPCFFNLRSARTLVKQPNSSDFLLPISNLLAQGANWDSLTSKFHSIQLTDPLVEKVLLNLRQPEAAKKALTFFRWSSKIQNFHHGLRSHCLLVHIVVRAGLLTDARVLLESCIKENVAKGSDRFSVVDTILSTYELMLPGPRVFDLLVQTYSKMRMVELAFDASCCFGRHGFCVSLISFNTMLRVAQKSSMNDLAWKVYEYMIERRVYPNQMTVETMVDVMCKEGSLRRMTSVLDRIHGSKCGPGAIVNLSLALRMFEGNRVEDGVVLLKRLLQKNLILDDVMNSLIIHGYCKTGKMELAYEFYDDMLKRGFDSNAFVHTSFMGAYCKEGKIQQALQLMDEMVSIGLKPYDETYSILIEGCSRLGQLTDSLEFCERMLKQGCILGPAACSEFMGSLSDAGKVDKASNILTALMDKGFDPNEQIYSKLMDGYGKVGKAEDVLKLYYEMEHRGLILSSVVFTSLIVNLCACGELEKAEKYLIIMEGRSVPPNGHIFDAMIKGYCKKGDIKQALYFYDDMMQRKLEPSADAFMTLVKNMVKVARKL